MSRLCSVLRVLRIHQSVDLVIKLEEWDKEKNTTVWVCMRSIQSILETRSYAILCQSVLVVIWQSSVESAAVNHRQKKMGYNAAEELYKRVQANLAKKREER